MTDIASLLDNLFADFEGDEAPLLPTIPTPLPTPAEAQHIEIITTSHSSRTSHTQNEAFRKTNDKTPSNMRVSDPGGSRVTSSHVEGAGSVGSAGSGAKTLAGSMPLPFPQDLENVGSVGRESAACERPILDLNHAAPLRSSLIGSAMADADRAAPPPGDLLPISPSDVCAGVARELRALAEDGREGPAALRDAVEITRAKIRNSEVLAERQAHGGRCHVCDGSLDDSAPVVAVMTGRRGAHLHLHAGCCAAHSVRMTALVDRIMVAAGYGADERTGEAA
ncbi:hypothetical protein D3273_22790 [Lichenibacterium minor]|uniref:Uncharacterized protein n=1 Tax=Lichenibacterium minor TaxID=2316528 RepID=A0A4Q2U043_9HYPH|nr:hypothetical protein [Lichenibacterium minor]RYC29642.1 hypothetical protein D3273_22790 [Lichenibacterium minor]